MALSLSDFRLALLSPRESLLRLQDATPLLPEVEVCCTCYFAESIIEWRAERYIAMVPLKRDSCSELMGRVAHLRQSPLAHVADYKFLSEEIIYRDLSGNKSFADMIIYRLPKASSLAELIAREGFDWQRLYEATYSSEAIFAAAKVCHNNLKLSNLMLSEDYSLLPIRYTYASFNKSREEVAAEWDALREWISSQDGVVVESPPKGSCRRVVAKFDSIEGEFEGLRVVCRDGRYGYIDYRGEEAIPPQYIWAEHFREGRAVVRAESGMGLIDSRGGVVIPLKYSIVDYNFRSGYARVKSDDGQWAIFNHNGEQVTLFEPKYISEEVIDNFSI